MKTSFHQKVLEVVSKIPAGKVLTYKQVAARVGSPRASRAVGTVLKHNFDNEIPCHRVIRSDFTPGEYNRGAQQKIHLLKKEGVNLFNS